MSLSRTSSTAHVTSPDHDIGSRKGGRISNQSIWSFEDDDDYDDEKNNDAHNNHDDKFMTHVLPETNNYKRM